MTSRYSRHSTHVGLVLTLALAIVLAGCAPSQAPVFIPDPASRKPHLALGMIKEFTVK